MKLKVKRKIQTEAKRKKDGLCKREKCKRHSVWGPRGEESKDSSKVILRK